MRTKSLALIVLLLAAACATTPPPAPPIVAPPPPPVAPAPIGLTRVLGRTADNVLALLGPATLDRVEGHGRQLQWSRTTCVLDLFLYPPTPGAEPLVKYTAARRRDGGPLDPASCLQSQLIARPVR